MFVDPLGLDFFGKKLAQDYICKYGVAAWTAARQDRNKNHDPAYPGTPAEELRNAENYLTNFSDVSYDSTSWGPALVRGVGYHTVKFWNVVADSYFPNQVNSGWRYDWPTADSLEASIEGANDALFGASPSCGCGGKQ